MAGRHKKPSLLKIQIVAIVLLGVAITAVVADRFRHRPSTAFAAVARDKTTSVTSEDPGLVQSVTDARASLPAFLRGAKHPLPSETGFAVKVPLGDRGRKEFVWLDPFRVEADHVIGKIANEIDLQDQYRAGQTIILPSGEIGGWTLKRGDVMLGNYSACAILSHETPEAKLDFKSTYRLDCADHGL